MSHSNIVHFFLNERIVVSIGVTGWNSVIGIDRCYMYIFNVLQIASIVASTPQ